MIELTAKSPIFSSNGWDMIRLDEKMGDFAVNSIMSFDDVELLELFSEEEKKGKKYWGVSTDL